MAVKIGFIVVVSIFNIFNVNIFNSVCLLFLQVLILCVRLTISQNENDKGIDFKTILSLLNAGEATAPEENNFAQPEEHDENEENETEEEGSGELQVTSVLDAFRPSKLLRPQLEILRLVESFLRLKGQMSSRVHALIYDNFDIFKSLYKVLVYKLSRLHGFSLQGIRIIRRIIEFALDLVGQWNIKTERQCMFLTIRIILQNKLATVISCCKYNIK